MKIRREIIKTIEAYLDSPEAIIVTGMHGTGKTTLLNYLFERINSGNKLFLPLGNPVNRRYFEVDNYENIKSTLEFLGLNFTHESYIFVDDIQFVKKLPSIATYFIDNYKVKFLMTCLGNFYSANQFENFLIGRKYLFTLSTLNFKEFLEFKGIKLVIPNETQKISKTIYDTIMPYYEQYLRFGGFPSVSLKKSTAEKIKALEEIFSSFYQLAAIHISDRRHGRVIRDLMLLLLNRIGTRLDMKELADELNISRPTLYRYFSFLETTDFISVIRPLNTKKSSEIKKMPKVYVCDTGLINLFAQVDEKCLFENSVYQNLKRRGEINYYHRKSGVKIDFIVDRKDAYDVRINPTESGQRKSETLTRGLSCVNCKIVSKNYSSLDKIVYGFML